MEKRKERCNFALSKDMVGASTIGGGSVRHSLSAASVDTRIPFVYGWEYVNIRDMRLLKFEVTLESYEEDPEFEKKLQELKDKVDIQDTLKSLINDTIE